MRQMRPRARWITRRRTGGVARVLVGARFQIGHLALQFSDGGLQRHHLIPEERDLALQENDVGLGDRREGGPNLRRQCRLFVHVGILVPTRPSAYPV